MNFLHLPSDETKKGTNQRASALVIVPLGVVAANGYSLLLAFTA